MRWIWSAVVMLGACGDDGAKTIDAAVTDGPQQIDAKVFEDAAADAAAPDPTKFIIGDEGGIISVFNLTDTGDVAPQRSIAGTTTKMNSPYGITFIPNVDEIVVANFDGGSVTVYPYTGTGDIAPTRELVGTQTLLSSPAGPGYSPSGDALVVCSEDGGYFVFARTATGDTAPIRHVTAGGMSGLAGCDGAIVDPIAGEIFILDGESSSIRVFALDATGDAMPTRVIAGTTTLLSYPSRGVIDRAHNELIVADENAGVLVFGLTASGDVAPVRNIIETTIQDSVDVALDAPHDELFVVDRQIPAVLVFNRTDTGDIAPKRTLTGTNTLFSSPAAIVLSP